jgi:hypothetical protein
VPGGHGPSGSVAVLVRVIYQSRVIHFIILERGAGGVKQKPEKFISYRAQLIESINSLSKSKKNSLSVHIVPV